MAVPFHSRKSLALSRRYKSRHENAEDNVTLDYRKDPELNIKEALTHIVKKEGISKNKKLGYYNAFVRLCHRLGGDLSLYYTTEKIISCLQIGLFHDAKEIRAASLRALRYITHNERHVEVLLTLHMDYLIARSLDLCLDNDIERIHALRLIRKILEVAPGKFPPSLLYVMISIANANDGPQERDKTVKACLATICEIAFSNPGIVYECGGISTIMQAALHCHQLPRINESLIATVLFLLNHPHTRHYIREDVDLERVLAPFTDCHILVEGVTKDQLGENKKEDQFIASKMAISTIMKSWPGLMRLCKPKGSGCQSLIGVLSLPRMDTRKEVMDVMFDVFRLSLPDWTDDFSYALLSIDPCRMRDSWRLSEGFVAEEGKSILPHLAKTRPNLVDNHMALILSAFIYNGLLEALVDVITSSDQCLAIRATILLGELLFMANNILPSDLCLHSHCLPSLLAMASAAHMSEETRNQAKQAVNWLNRHHAMKKRSPVPLSLFLDQIMQRSVQAGISAKHTQRVNKDKLLQCLGKESEQEFIGQAVRDSQVLHTKSGNSWDWDLISTILRWPEGGLRKLDDQANLKFLRRLLYYFKPSNKLYAAVELSEEKSRNMSIAFLNFVDFLVDCEESEAQRCAEELLRDVASALGQVSTKVAPADATFTPSTLMQTLSQDYFLVIGRFSNTLRGDKLLENSGVYQNLLDVVTKTTHDTFIKLIVSALDYSRDGQARIILSKALTATSEAARLYTTGLMRVLLRARVPFLANWGMEMLVMQLYDQAKPVAMEALSVISEACEDEVNILTLINMRPAVLHLGYKGTILHARFLSMPLGFKSAMESNYVLNDLEKWHKVYNVKYVSVVEERLNEALTTYEKTYDGSYTRRSASAKRQARKDVYVPIHLYGQLVQHKDGFKLLERQPYISSYFQCIRIQPLHNAQQLIKLKAALWVVGHIGTSIWGLGLLEEEVIIPEIIKLAEECGVFSVRGAAFYVLGLIASTEKGASILHEYGWEAVRRLHNELWPVLVDGVHYQPDVLVDRLSTSSSTSMLGSLKSESMFSPRYVSTDMVNPQLQPSPSASLGASPKDNVSLGEYSDPGEMKSRSSTTESIDLPTDPTQPIIISVSENNSPQEHCDSLSPSDSFPKAPPRRKNRNSSDLSTTESFQTPPTSYGLIEGSTAIVIDSDATVHGRSQSDPACSNCVNHTQDRDNQTTVQFRIGSRDSECELSRDYLQEPVLRNRSNSADAAPRFVAASLRNQHGGSHESSRTSKSHSDSIRTDTSNTTTSGIGSCDSGGGVQEPVTLSPIPSASSMATDKSQACLTPDSGTSKHMHPTDTLRQRANLRRIPSLKRGNSNPSFSHTSVSPSNMMTQSLIEGSIYTSPRDSQGFTALRELQRNRSIMGNMEAELIDYWVDEPNVPKTRSLLDFRPGRPRNGIKRNLASVPASKLRQNLLSCGSCSRNLSISSLLEINEPLTPPVTPRGTLMRPMSRDPLKKSSSKMDTAGRAQYIGLCLPVDVTMMFQVGEDPRCALPYQNDQQGEKPTVTEKKTKRSISEMETDNGLEFHSIDTCLACRTKNSSPTSNTEETAGERGPSPLTMLQVNPVSLYKGLKSRNSSMTDLMQGSVTSTTSIDSAAKGVMSEDSDTGKCLIHKEVIRLIVSMSSSVGVKGSEQGLLILKQKFASAFQDPCLYSEVSYMLGHYNYRLSARRFIQELFQDLDYSVLYEEACTILDLNEKPANEEGKDSMLDKLLESIA